MRHRTHHSVLLPLLACWLTVASSGDDFNLLRAALPQTFASCPVGQLPLDDPNTDFVPPTTTDQVGLSIERSSQLAGARLLTAIPPTSAAWFYDAISSGV
ncbi:MAG TPA: hypothetical protein VFA18_04910, partial [Gemmataceae bacterium]|nr:hypothetical protein [Gemmataceae bacterium]